MGLFDIKKKTVSTESLSFSRHEMAAIIQLAGTMSGADGTAHPNEMKMMMQEAIRFGVGRADFASLLEQASKMEGTAAMAEIATMSDAQKRYVCAYLGTLMAIDGDINDKEKAMWQLVSTICKLPTMSIADAIEYMAN